MSNPIYNDPLSISERYAKDRKEVEAYSSEFRVPPAGEHAIAQQTTIQTVTPQPPALVMLMNLDQRVTWAKMAPPPTFFSQYIFSQRFAPLMGYSEKQDADIQKIRALSETEGDPAVTVEGQIIIDMLEKGIKEPNALCDFIQAKMREFVSA